jgi:hypothetical protein
MFFTIGDPVAANSLNQSTWPDDKHKSWRRNSSASSLEAMMTSGTPVTVRAIQDPHRRSGESADVRFLAATAFSLILVVIALYAVTMSSGPDPQAFATMVAYP